MTANAIVFIFYVVLGPAPWALFAFGMALGYTRMNRLRRPAKPLPDPPPLVTILIPAKDEGANISACLNSTLAQDYPNFEIIAINDRSTDETGQIIDGIAANASRFRSLHIQHLPEGWLGKCNALATAARDAKGKWLLFVDSDVKLSPDVLSIVLAQAEERKYDAVSIMTRLECHNFWETLLMPLNAATVSTICTISLTNSDNRPGIAFANGQFFLIRRDVYEAVGGHGAVRDQIVEDVELMRLIKSKEFKTRLFSGQKFASTRMHDTLAKMFSGWARIYSGVTRRRPVRLFVAIFFVLISALSCYPAIIWGWQSHDRGWLFTGVAHWALVTTLLMVIYGWSGNRRWYALIYPLAAPMMAAIYVNAIRSCFSGKIAWRGTNYSFDPHRAG